MPIAALLALAAATPCALGTPAGCGSTTALLRAPGAVAAVAAVTAGRRANYLSADLSPVAEQALAVLGGVSDRPRRIGDGWLFAGCRAQSCGEKGAVAIDGAGRVVAVAILHGSCGVQRAKPGCADERSLSIHGGTLAAPMRAALLAWAKAAGGGVMPPVFENGEGEPLLVADGDFDGDRLPDRAVLVGAPRGYRVEVTRGAEPGTPVPVADLASAANAYLEPGASGGLTFGTRGASAALARWSGAGFAVEWRTD